jgi:repressor LexA
MLATTHQPFALATRRPKPARQITDRQRAVLDFLRGYIEANGFPPSIREIGEHFGVTPNGVVSNLLALQRKGYISRVEGACRSIRVIDKVQPLENIVDGI